MINPVANMMLAVETLAHLTNMIYFTIVKYSGIVQTHCTDAARDAVSRYRACYC